jgi:hypothetical protein
MDLTQFYQQLHQLAAELAEAVLVSILVLLVVLAVAAEQEQELAEAVQLIKVMQVVTLYKVRPQLLQQEAVVLTQLAATLHLYQHQPAALAAQVLQL